MAKTIRLSSVDAAFLYLETPETPMHVGSLSLFKMPDGYTGNFFEAFKAQIADRMDVAPMLKRKLVPTLLDIDHPSWIEDDQFDLDRHVLRAGLPEPDDLATLRRVVGWMHAKLLNRARPLWEFYVFDGLHDNLVGLYSKVHHSLIDGGAGVALTKIIYDVTANPPPRQRQTADAGVETTDPDEERFGGLRAAGAALESYARLWTRPLGSKPETFSLPRTGKSGLGPTLLDHALTQVETGVNAAAAFPAMARAAAKALPGLLDVSKLGELRKLATPMTPLNRAISSERAFGATTLSMSRAKAVGKAAGGKLNDVVLALSSGMLRRHLIAIGSLPDKSLSAAVPISLREEGNADANNQVFSMICQLATDVADPRERMAAIIADATRAKELVSPMKDFAPLMQNISTLGAPMAMQMLAMVHARSGLSDVMPPPANVTISNVPGPRMTLYGAGAELLHIWPVSIPAHGLALNITVQSYRDNLEFGLVAGANVLPEVQGLADMLEEELVVLEKAFGLAEAPPAKAPAPKASRSARRKSSKAGHAETPPPI